jgi:transposase InsO family protein
LSASSTALFPGLDGFPLRRVRRKLEQLEANAGSVKLVSGALLLPVARGKPGIEADVGRESRGSGFFRRCLAQSEAGDAVHRRRWRTCLYAEIGTQSEAQGTLTLAAQLPLAVLAQAIARRQPPPGLVHHSDRGVQYASHYIGLLEAHSMTPSMSRSANRYDNATCESFMKTLNHEEIYCRDYRDIDHLRRHVEEFLDRNYNHQRLHSALGYRIPAEFEQQCLTNGADAGVTVPRLSFFRHGKSIAPMPIQSLSGGR